MADPRSLADSSILSSPLHSRTAVRGDSGAHTGRDYHAGPSGSSNANVGEDRVNEEETVWYSAIPDIPLPQYSGSQTNQLPTPRSHGADNAFPFFPTAVASPESPLINARSRLLGGIPNSAPGTAPARSQARLDPCTDPEQRRTNKFAMQPQAITPRASPISSPTSLPPRPMSLPLLSSSSREPPGVVVKTESPPPMLAPPHVISPSRAAEISLSSPFVEKPTPILGTTRQHHPFYLRPTDSPTPSSSKPARPLVLSSPAHIEDRASLPIQMSSIAEFPTEEPSRRPGGELNRIRNHMMEVEETRRAELESRRPDYLKRLHPGEEVGPSSVQVLQDGTADKNAIGIMETPARGRRIQLFDFQETSAESFEESLMKHGYGTYGEPRTPHTSLAATEGLSKEAYDWLVNNTPAAVPGAAQSYMIPDAELNEKELKKRKRLEAFRGSTARALSSKLYPTEMEPFGRVLVNMTAVELEELNAPPAKKRATGRRKRGGAAAAERRGKALRGSTPVHTGSTQPRWLDKELPWCLREREREKEQKARDEEQIKWIESYFARDTTDEDSDKSEEDNASPIWDQEEEAENPTDVPAPGRGKAVSVQANPKPKRSEPATDGRKNRSLYFPTDPADARTALMSKRNVRILAQKKLRASGQRHASLRGYREGRLACTCGAKDDDGTPAVQCDDCYDWYHLKCMGVRDEAELGDWDDPWFCPPCSEKADAAMSAADWRNQRQPTFVPTDERPVHTSARKDVAFYSSSPLRDWGSSGSLATPVQEQGRLHGASGPGEPFRRLIWDDSHSGPHPSTARVVHVHTPGRDHGFDPMSSPRTNFSRVTSMSFTTPKNNASGGSMGSGFGLPWPPPTGLFATPTPSGRGSSAYGFGGYDSSSSRVNAMYETDDTPIRRAPVKESGSYVSGAHHPSLYSPLSGRGGQRTAAPLASSRAERNREQVRTPTA